MEWYEELGFEDNPFNLNPIETDYKLIGRDDEAKELFYRISSGSMLFIEGNESVGKTALLKYAIDNFKGKGKVVYVDGKKLSKRLDVSKLIKKKGMILLLDNVEHLSKKNNEKIKYYFDEDLIKSVVFTASDYSSVDFTNAIRDRIGRNIIQLDPLKLDEVLRIVEERLGKIKILPRNVLNRLFEDVVNLKDFLKKSELLSKRVVEKSKTKATINDIKDIDQEIIDEETEDDTEICPDCDTNLMKYGGHWRCENCDQFCTGCGTLLDEEDLTCPGCGALFIEEEQ